MSEKNEVLTYKGHPLMRKDNLVYYGSMADEFIVMQQRSPSSSSARIPPPRRATAW